MNPTVSGMGGVLSSLFSGSTVTAMVLMIDIQGPELLKALQTSDLYLAGGIVMTQAVLVVIGILLSDIALAFLTRIEEAGYTGMVYGNKEWLLKRVELHRFEDYDVWLAQEDNIPDYPYVYSMWQYTKQGEVYGIEGYVDLNISFIDYSAR